MRLICTSKSLNTSAFQKVPQKRLMQSDKLLPDNGQTATYSHQRGLLQPRPRLSWPPLGNAKGRGSWGI